jgi:HTH-type transcriptional regulator/antitoxin HigA
MRPKTIRNDTDHREALAEIERLMISNPTIGSEEADRLDVLSLLTEEFEKSAFPIDLPTPIEAIKFRMEQAGLEQRDLIPFIGSRARVSEVLGGKRALTLTMMRALHSGLGIPAAVLLGEEAAEVEPVTKTDCSRFPLRKMAEFGWLNAPKRILTKHADALMEKFTAPLGGFTPASNMLLRRTRTLRSGRQMDPHALEAWCMRVQIRALDCRLTKTFSAANLDKDVFREIAQMSANADGPLLAAERIRALGIHFIVERHLPKTHLDGAALLSKDNTPIIALTLRHDRLDSFWFCLLHELAHVALHLGRNTKACIDDMDAPSSGSAIEQQADQKAREALVPSKIFRKSRAYSVRSVATAIDLASTLNVHPAVVAGRIRYESGDYRLLSQLVSNGEVKRLFPEVFRGE